MKDVVDTLEPTSTESARDAHDRQFRLFKALYDVAAKYVEAKHRLNRRHGERGLSGMASQKYAEPTPSITPFTSAQSDTLVSESNLSDPLQWVNNIDDMGMGLEDGLHGLASLQAPAFGDVEMEMDASGAQLWDWFNKNQAMMRMLEDP